MMPLLEFLTEGDHTVHPDPRVLSISPTTEYTEVAKQLSAVKRRIGVLSAVLGVDVDGK